MHNSNGNGLAIEFLSDLQKDQTGRTHSCILQFSEDEIENNHDFIQWIFPTKEPSRFNQYAPIIDNAFQKLFAESIVAQQNFCKSCNIFLKFIGFNCTGKNGSINKIHGAQMFYNRPTHNLLRITRALTSLNQIGNKECSQRLFEQIKEIYNSNSDKISSTSFTFWEATQNNNNDSK